MKTYKLKSAARRGSMLGAAFAIVAASFVPVITSYADALNPLTDRSLTLSSSAPGWDYKDGSGNTTYADPNSGANGQKTGNTFSFKVSTDSSATGTNAPVKALTFQYCMHPAGTCTAPGTNGTASGVRNPDSVSAQTSDLNVAVDAPTQKEMDNTGDAFITTTGANAGSVMAVPNKDGSQGNYIVMTEDAGATTWTQSTGWTMAVSNNEDGQTVSGNVPINTEAPTGKNNFIKLTNATGLSLKAGGRVKIIFFGTTNNYITNPGKGAFFVKINDYKDSTTLDSTTLVDGGVTVANVMNLGISIQTKVLETMDFSVGTVDPDTLSHAQLSTATSGGTTSHGLCDPILNGMNPTDPKNTLLLGNEVGEHSLETGHTYSTHSYFRLSSNASAGATVYYSGVTLSNTVGDQIAAIGPTKKSPQRGTEQFGLALDNDTNGNLANHDATYQVNYATERASGEVYESGADNTANGLVLLGGGTGTGLDPSVATDWSGTTAAKAPQLKVNADGTALAPLDNYNQGSGVINGGGSYTDGAATPSNAINTLFAFDTTSNKIPVPIASEQSKVVDCASAKVRYIANIAATTPAGIYTTKINYIAAPQY